MPQAKNIRVNLILSTYEHSLNTRTVHRIQPMNTHWIQLMNVHWIQPMNTHWIQPMNVHWIQLMNVHWIRPMTIHWIRGTFTEYEEHSLNTTHDHSLNMRNVHLDNLVVMTSVQNPSSINEAHAKILPTSHAHWVNQLAQHYGLKCRICLPIFCNEVQGFSSFSKGKTKQKPNK